MPNDVGKVYTISQLNGAARMLLEDNFPLIWVEGEVSNLAQPNSGHIYFTLKDASAQIRCAMFRGRSNNIIFKIANGAQVLVQAQISIYEPRGDYQLIVQQMELAGDGILRRKFEELKQRLAAAGLFASEHKKSIPQFPQAIGIITSPTGAALQDILNVLKRRFAAIPIMIYPTQVQGNEAAGQIVKAIELANKHKQCDTLILARGGGSLEDLWSFNEEIVARAIYASEIPIISGVGHEIDFTIADLVADLRAPTPSAAAELASPNADELETKLEHLSNKCQQLMRQKISQAESILNNLAKRLRHPRQKLQDFNQQLDNYEQRLNLAIRNYLQHQTSKLNNLAASLDAISPLATLKRGYAIITHRANGKIIRSIPEVKPGEKILARLQDGELECIVENKTCV
jgi:exodeoxyribonuclease VII large subunit